MNNIKSFLNEINDEGVIKSILRDRWEITTTNSPNLKIPKLVCKICEDFEKEHKEEAEIISFDNYNFNIEIRTPYSYEEAEFFEFNKGVPDDLKEELTKMEQYSIFGVIHKEKEHMNIYSDINGVKRIKSENLFKGIKNALYDLGDYYNEKTVILLSYSDFYDIVKELGDKNINFYFLTPEQILGTNIIFCNHIEKPIIGDFSKIYANYQDDIKLTLEKIEESIIHYNFSGSFDIRILNPSAFRIVETV